MSGYSKEELERLIPFIEKKVNEALERQDDREVALQRDALKQLKEEFGRMLAEQELAMQAAQNAASPPQPPPQPAATVPEDQSRERLRKAAMVAGHIGRGTKTVAGHVGRRTAQAGRAIGSGARGAYNLADQHQATIFFIPIAAFVIFFEFFSVYAGTWPIRVSYYTVIVLLTLIFRDFELTKRAAFAALVVNGVWWLYLTGAGTPGMSAALISPVAKMIATVFILPGFVWYLLYLEPNIEIAKVFRNIGWIPIVGAMIALIYPAMSSAAGLIPTPPTGFDPQPAARDAIGFILGGAGEAVRDLVCYLGIGGGACSTADSWLARITEPFAYDATTVHEIQRHNLGVYIRNAEVDGTVEVTGYSPGSFLPKSIDFTIHAPIPEDLEIELCNARASDLKGFPGICNNTITVTCTIDGVSTTQIVPRSELSIKTVVVPGLYSCRMQAPADAALNRAGSSVSKRAEIKVEYPFVTTTFKLIRAVDIDRATTREARAELDNFRESRVISSGGPVIVEVSDSPFVRVDGDNTIEGLTINLQAQPEVRIEGIDSLYILVPEGSALEPYPGDTNSYCDFVVGEDAVRSEVGSICNRDEWGGCFSDEIPCHGLCARREDGCTTREEAIAAGARAPYVDGTEPGDRNTVSTCAVDVDDLLGDIFSDRPSQVYMLSKAAIERINADLAAQAFEADARRFTIGSRDNSVRIGCQLKITDKDTFLQDEVLVTERAVNIISSYRVSHAQEVNVRFSGRVGETPRLPSAPSFTPSTQGICSIEGMSLQIPVGILPAESTTARLTEPFGWPRGNSFGYHTGTDLAGKSPGDQVPIRASWGGVVEYIKQGCNNNGDGCGSGGHYGNHVIIRTTTPTGSFTHLYSHFSSIDNGLKAGQPVAQGQQLGTSGNSGYSFGVHLHFEMRASDGKTRLNPLLFMPKEEAAALIARGNPYGKTYSSTEALKTFHDVTCTPVLHGFSSDEIVAARNAAEQIANSFRGGSTPAPHVTRAIIELLVDSAIERNVPPDLLIGMAMKENKFNHTHALDAGEKQWAGKLALSYDNESIGMMQIQSIGRQTMCSEVYGDYQKEWQRQNPGRDLTYPDAHVDLAFHTRCAAEIFYDKYKDVDRLLSQYGEFCGLSCPCIPPGSNNNIKEEYDHSTLYPSDSDPWIAAMKGYNGWGCQPTQAEATEYTESIIEYANRVRTAIDMPPRVHP
jgi:murein DD-endopeptidase MepM/ murein hydrolase activator NlpD